MDVTYSNNLTNTVKTFRETIYCTDTFKKSFSSNLENTIQAENISYIPDQFGGWSVNMTTNSKKEESKDYVSIVSTVLADTINEIDKSISCKDLAANLSNILTTGPNSISIRI